MSCEVSWVDMCRTCMEVDGELYSLYDETAEITENDYAYKLNKIASIEVHKQDGLPSKICDKCAYRTNAFFDFQNLIQESDRKLKDVFDAQFSANEKEEKVQQQMIVDTPILPEIENNKDWISTTDKMLDVSYDDFDKLQLDFQSENEEGAMLNELDDVCNSHILNVEDNFNNLLDDQIEPKNICIPMESEDFLKINTTDISECLNDQTNFKTDKLDSLILETTNLNNETNHITDSTSDDHSKIVDEYLIENQKLNSNEENNPNDGCDNSDSDNGLQGGDYTLGSINDTITKIKEIKENGIIKQYQCTLCMQSYPILFEILCHIIDLHVPVKGPFFCVVCEMDCKDIKELKSHVKTHKGPTPYTCFLCNKSYEMKRYLKRHMVCHTDFPRYRCSKCGKRFRVKNELESHTQSEHDEGVIYKCSQCTKSYNHKGNYKRHLITHLDPKGLYLPKFPCIFCNRRFLNNRCLTIHMRAHTGEKPFKCDTCNKSFSQQGNLMNHAKIHKNPRSFKCEICKKCFNQKSTLRDHSLLHSGEKPYVCNFCGIAYTFSAALRRHMWSHSDQKPYECDICKAKFTGRYDIRRHLKIHDGTTRLKKSKKKRGSNKNVASKEKIKIMEEPNDTNTIFMKHIFLSNGDSIQIISSEKKSANSVLPDLIQY